MDPGTCYEKNSYCYFHYASKECFWSKKKFEFHARVQFCQNGIFEPFHEIQIFFYVDKSILLRHYENANRKKFHNMSQGLPNPGFMQEKVQKGNFL